MDFGKLVKEERERQGISLRKLWSMTGIRDTTICNWENGHAPPADKLDKVLKALKVSITIGLTTEESEDKSIK